MILVFLERSGSQFHRLSLETLAAAQQVGASMNLPVASVVIGSGARDSPGGGTIYVISTRYSSGTRLTVTPSRSNRSFEPSSRPTSSSRTPILFATSLRSWPRDSNGCW